MLELIADMVAYASHKNAFPNESVPQLYYFSRCTRNQLPNKPTDAMNAVTTAALEGSIPQWFSDLYMPSQGTFRMVELWNDIRDPDLSWDDPVKRVYFFHTMFGGFCSYAEAKASLRANVDDWANHTDNPWVDGGCESLRPGDAQVVAGDGALEVSWQAPLWTREPDADGYVVQWKGPGEDYHSSRQTRLNGLTSLTTTITGLTNGTQYTIRVAAVRSSDPGNFLNRRGQKRYTEVAGRPTT